MSYNTIKALRKAQHTQQTTATAQHILNICNSNTTLQQTLTAYNTTYKQHFINILKACNVDYLYV